MSKVTYQDIKTLTKVDTTTGEIKEVETTTERQVQIEREPDFIKLYIKDICKLNDIPKTPHRLLNELLKYTSYENKILLPSAIKKEIASKLNTSVQVVDNSLSKLTKKEILKRVGTGVYMLNPFFFGKGKWTDIKKVRMVWEYGEEERRVLSEVKIEEVAQD